MCIGQARNGGSAGGPGLAASFPLLALLPLSALLVLAPVGVAGAEPTFPPLTGRVVDVAGLMSAGQEAQLSRRLEAHERATGNQVVVATLDDLQGYSIEEYGYQLGRSWGIGEKGKDTGVLLVVAPSERAVRIEVGYGLEGELTDAISSNIIHGVIVPEFRRGRFGEGIEAGAVAIIAALGGQYEMRSVRPRSGAPQSTGGRLLLLILFFATPGMFFFGSRAGYVSRHGMGMGMGYGGYGGGFGRGGGGFGGGFSGGGGGFGGGGASGGW